MRICFDTKKENLLFVDEGAQETKWLAKFPAFTKTSSTGFYNTVPAVLPVAYNVVTRIQKAGKKPRIDADVAQWLAQEFELSKLPESFSYHTKPKDFQEIALRFLYTLKSAGILLDPGMGKSKVALDYIWLMQFERVIIVCPCALLFVWEDEIFKHRPELSFHTVLTTDWEKEKQGILANRVTIINYTKVSILKHRLQEVDYKYIHVDEFLIKDSTTERTKSITELSKSISFRSGGSGTLINNSPLDAFSPIRFLHPGLVGWNFRNFLDRYTVQRRVTRNEREQNIVVATKGHDEVRSMLESCSIVMTKEHWLKLPSKTFVDVNAPMVDEQRRVYFELLSNYYTSFQGKDIKVDNPLVMLSKLYQISNGFIYINQEDPKDVSIQLLLDVEKSKTKKRQTEVCYFQESPKKVALQNLILAEDLKGKRAIIWYNMHGELHQIQDVLEAAGHTYIVIKGGETKLGEKVRNFNKNPSIRWMVCQAQSVNYGITVLGTRREDLEKEFMEVMPDIDSQIFTEIFFSLSFSLERYLQQQDRIHRLGQENECTYYRILTNSPVERKIKEALRDKLSIKEDLLVDIATTLLKETELG